MDRHIAEFADAAIALRFLMPVCKLLLVDGVGFVCREDVEAQMFKTQLTLMQVLLRRSGFEIHEDNKVRVKFWLAQVVIAGTLGQVDVVLQNRSAGLYLNPQLSPSVLRFHNEVTTCEVVTQPASEIGRYTVHPALCVDGSLADPTVRLGLPKVVHQWCQFVIRFSINRWTLI